MGCKVCGGAWEPLFRIVDSYEHGEPIDNFCECETCENDWHEDDPACKECENAPFYNRNVLNISVYVLGDQMVFEDKRKGCHKVRRKINFCPDCGAPLTKPEPLTLEQLRQMAREPLKH